jgi:hypothetical protein
MWEINLMSKVSPVDLRNHRTRLKSYESRWNSNSRKEKKKKNTSRAQWLKPRILNYLRGRN